MSKLPHFLFSLAAALTAGGAAAWQAQDRAIDDAGGGGAGAATSTKLPVRKNVNLAGASGSDWTGRKGAVRGSESSGGVPMVSRSRRCQVDYRVVDAKTDEACPAP